MFNKILLPISFALMLFSACRKETSSDEQNFGFFKLTNATSSTLLKISYNDVPATLLDYSRIKVPVGKGLLRFEAGNGFVLLDTLLDVQENVIKNYVLFQPVDGSKAVLIENNQEAEPKPEAGFIKVRIANMATNSLPAKPDVIMKMVDYNYGDEVDMDTIKGAEPSFGEYSLYTVFDPSFTDGVISYFITEPVSGAQIRVGSSDINSAGGAFFNILTLAITEKPDENGAFTGKDGKKYTVEVKALFIN